MQNSQKQSIGMRSARELGLPAGDAVLRRGRVVVLPPDHGLDDPRWDELRLDDPRVEIGPAMPSPVTTRTVLKSSHVDRATGFHIATARLSLAFVVAGALISVWGFNAPLISMVTLGFMFGFYALAWVLGWLVYQFISPEGATILHALLGYRLIRHEQRARLARYRRR